MPRQMTNAEAAASFRLLADLLSIRGESAFRVEAYRRAADSIEHLPESLAAVRARGELEQIHGVGKEIAQKISDLLDTGTFPALEAVKRDVPPGTAELLRVPGVGPKRARTLQRELGIDSLERLQAALDERRLDGVAGLGAAFAKKVAAALPTLAAGEERVPIGVAWRRGQEVLEQLRERASGILRVELVGSIRRFRDTIGDLDIAAAADDPGAVVEAFLSLPAVSEVEMRGANRGRVRLQNGMSADLWVLPPGHWGSLLVHTTADKHHAIALRDVAIERGAHLSEYGFTVDGTLTPCATEEEVYAFLDMDFIPPPMREDRGEIDLARRHALPAVVTLADLRGDLHMHTHWSDGAASVREMALAARARGYEYLCITDHSGGLAIAGGLDAGRLQAQRVEIDEVNEDLAPFRILQGVEVEVRADGSLDLDDEVLARLDFTIASVHSSLRQDRARLTQRALAALRHPLVDLLAHPTGRIIGKRPGGDFDLEAIFAEAARTGTVLEINGDPARLDLSDLNARAAVAAGCTLSIGSDAHSTGGLDNAVFGIGTAQRGWVPPERVLTTLPLDAMLARLKRNRSDAARG